MKKIISCLSLIILTLSCSTSPTGRRQLKLMPSQQMTSMGTQSFEQLQKAAKLSNNTSYNKKIRCITDRLLLAMGESPAKWTIKIFEDSSPNAFALPGNKMGIHTGMIELAASDDQLAAVIGHEIGHVLAEHGNERISQNAIVHFGMTATQLYLGSSHRNDNLILAGLGVGAQLAYILPFSRTHESEADALGVKYMAIAGFNPAQAAELWKLMKKKGGPAAPEFLSTHPSPATRIDKLNALAPVYQKTYEARKRPNGC